MVMKEPVHLDLDSCHVIFEGKKNIGILMLVLWNF